MRHRLVGAVMALALGCSVLVLSSAQPAQAATLGTAWTKGFSCTLAPGWRQVNAFPPQMTSISGAVEYVYWSPDLYRWNGTSWYLYDGSKPWYWAWANSNGVVYRPDQPGTWFAPNNIGIQYAPYNNLPAGSYKVVDYYRWSNGATSSAWSYFRGDGGPYCTFNY